MLSCGGCHGRFDPFGHTFQTYDAIGRFSTTQQVVKDATGKFVRQTVPPIDTSSTISDSVGKDLAGPVSGVVELAQKINKMGPNRRVAYCAGRKLSLFSLGADPTQINSCALKDVKESFYKTGSFLDFYKALATSPGFATRNPG